MAITRNKIEQEISLGNINPKILRDFFNDLKLRSYSYVYNMQKELVNYGERKIDASKGRSFLAKGVFHEGYDRVIEFTIDYQFTIPGEKEMYLRSKVFNSYMDFETLNKNKKYFRFVPLIFGDNKLLFNYRMQAYNERLNIFFLDKEFDKDIKELTILFIPDSIVTVTDPVTRDFNGTNIRFDKFEASKEFKKVKSYIAFWIHKETRIPYIVPIVTKNQKDKYFTIGTLLPTDVTKFKLMLVGINNLYSVAQIKAGVKWLTYDKHNMPIPKDNNIIFIRKDANYFPNDGTVELKEYYPNIFEIINPNNYNLVILSLYEHNTSNDHIYYDDECRLYSRMHNIFSEYENGTIPTEIKDFKPLPWNYSISDFIAKKSYKDIDFDNDWDSFIYKIETISEMLKKWALLYEEYQKRTYGFLTGWYHNLSKFDNLDRKTRNNIIEDINEPGFDYKFKEPHYVFTYLKDQSIGEVNSFCFFIDGKYTIPTKVVIYRGIQYVYFPKRLFNPDSIIEVERFDGNYFYRNISLPYVDPSPSTSIPLDTAMNDLTVEDETNGDVDINGTIMEDLSDSEIIIPEIIVKDIFIDTKDYPENTGMSFSKNDNSLIIADKTLGNINIKTASMENAVGDITLPDISIRETQLDIENDQENPELRLDKSNTRVFINADYIDMNNNNVLVNTEDEVTNNNIDINDMFIAFEDPDFKNENEMIVNVKNEENIDINHATISDANAEIVVSEININKTSINFTNCSEFMKGTVLPLTGILTTNTVANSIFLVDPLGNFVTKDQVRVFVIDRELGDIEVDLNESVFIVEKDSKLKIVPINYNYDNITVCCNNITYQYTAKESGNDFLYGREMEVNLNNRRNIGKIKKDIAHRLRIFNHEGRLIPKRSYNIYAYDNYNKFPQFNIPINYGTNEDLIISYIGYDERLIYHEENIPNTGFIDLRGILTRPFNLAYHDLYLDGYRLTKYDIEMITPFSFVIKTLTKFNTLNNIEIYEKVHNINNLVKYEWEEESEYLMDKLFKPGASFYEEIVQSLDKINVSGEVKDIDSFRDWLFSFFNDYIPFKFMNSDYRYDLEAYHHIFDDKTGRILLNSDDRVRYIKLVKTLYYSNHDSSMNVYGNSLEDYPKSPIEIRNINESTLVPDDKIVMSEDHYSRHGYWVDNFERVYSTRFHPYNDIFVPTTRNRNEIYYNKTVEDVETKTFKRERDISIHYIDPFH